MPKSKMSKLNIQRSIRDRHFAGRFVLMGYLSVVDQKHLPSRLWQLKDD